MSTFEFDDKLHTERLTGKLHSPGATPGDVPTAQADGSLLLAPGGGSQPGIKMVRVPFAFDTLNIVTPGAGLVVYTPQAGEAILGILSYMSITEGWNGTNPAINFTWSDLASEFTSASLVDPDQVSSADGHTLVPVVSGQLTELRGIFPDSSPFTAIIDDTAGGDPGSSQGAGEFVLFIAELAGP